VDNHSFRFSRLLLTLLGLLMLAVAVWGCSDGSPNVDSNGPAEGLSGESQGVDGSQEVTFTTADGIELSGRAFGVGDIGLVLAHMYPADQTSWFPAAEELAAQGYLVLTFDFRGYGESSGSKDIALIDRDVEAAVKQIEALGAENVGLVGASMGGTACLMVAASDPVAAVATLSAPVEFRGLSAAEAVTQVQAPKLFMAAEDDVGAQGARDLYDSAQDPREILIVPGSDHGTDLLDGDSGDEAWAALVGFLQRNVPVER